MQLNMTFNFITETRMLAVTEAAADLHPTLDLDKAPGHWVLAKLGKRVLRPGGMELTHAMLDGLAIGSADDVVEFAPGLGTTADITLERAPKTYVAVERDDAAAARLQRRFSKENHRCVLGTAFATTLPSECASVVYGEAMLSMHTAKQKTLIVREAARLLPSGGRYGVHELALCPDDLHEATKDRIAKDLSAALRVGARPLTRSEWCSLLEQEGFAVEQTTEAPMHLLEPARLLADEGFLGVLRIGANLARSRAARSRVLSMRRAFRTHASSLSAIALVARKR